MILYTHVDDFKTLFKMCRGPSTAADICCSVSGQGGHRSHIRSGATGASRQVQMEASAEGAPPKPQRTNVKHSSGNGSQNATYLVQRVRCSNTHRSDNDDWFVRVSTLVRQQQMTLRRDAEADCLQMTLQRFF
jgi:hypothetical protein